jgi:dienelactone hydrolase
MAERRRRDAAIAGVAVTALVLGLGLAGCGDDGDGGASGSTTTVAPATTSTTAMVPDADARPYGVTTATETFVDDSRPTPAAAGQPELASRTLVTEVYVPDTPGPAPLIVFSHGFNGHPDKFTRLLTTWAEAGYVVAAPAFPLTNDESPGVSQGAGDYRNQPGDVSFVIDEMLRLAGDPSSPYDERIDPTRIGVGGLSLGAVTTYGVTFNSCCADDRVDAAEVLAGALLPFDGDYVLDGRVPLLIVHGDADPALPYQGDVDAYEQAEPPVWLVTLLGAGHAPPFEDAVTPYDDTVEALTTDFWDMTLGDVPGARDRFESDAVVDGLATLQSSPG